MSLQPSVDGCRKISLQQKFRPKESRIHTARINTKDTDALALQFLTEPFGEHGARSIGLAIRGPRLIGLSIL